MMLKSLELEQNGKLLKLLDNAWLNKETNKYTGILIEVPKVHAILDK
jgi:hypothetical protein